MLILESNENEKIKIGDNIYVRSFRNPRTGKMKIAIEAPREIPIIRIKSNIKDAMKKPA